MTVVGSERWGYTEGSGSRYGLSRSDSRSRSAEWCRLWDGDNASGGSSMRGETLSVCACGGATGDGVYVGVARVIGTRFTWGAGPEPVFAPEPTGPG